MQSAPMALMWEYWRQSRWTLLTGTLGITALPAMIYGILSLEGAFDPHEPGFRHMQFVWFLTQMFCIGATAFPNPQAVGRMYALPATAWSLTIWRMIPCLTLAAAMFLSTNLVLNLLFQFNWPLLPPVLFLVTAMACLLATAWWAGKSQWLAFVCVSVVGIALGFWLKWHYGGWTVDAPDVWTEVTPGDWITMGLAFAFALYIAHVGVARSRRGDVFTFPRLWEFFGWLFYPVGAVLEFCLNNRPGGSRTLVQFWYEWRNKGLVLPALLVAALVAGFPYWAWFGFPAGLLVRYLIGLVTVAPFMAAMLGLAVGHCGTETQAEMGTFLATRPLSDSEYAGALLRVATRALLLTWGLWAALFVPTVAVLYLAWGREPLALLLRNGEPSVELRVLPLLIFGSFGGGWTLNCIAMSLTATGRFRFYVPFLMGSFSIVILWLLATKFLIPADLLPSMINAVLCLIGIACFLVTVMAYVAARKKSFVAPSTMGIAAGAWVVISLTLLLAWHFLVPHKPLTLPLSLFFLGVMALAVAPPATMPLAVAWNRHR